MIVIPRVAPGSAFPGAVGQIWGIMQAEITMQWRRWGLWLAFAGSTALLLLLTVQAATFLLHLPPTSMYVREHFTSVDLDNLLVASTVVYGVMFFGLVAALLVVDRLRRDQHLGMVELQRATPQGSARYVLGKFLGNYVAVLVPAFLSYLLCALMTMLLGWSAVLLSKFLLAFLLVFVPSSLAAVSLTLLLTSFLPLRLVQVSFSLLWFYFETGLGRYGFGSSIFNPSGIYIYPVFFPVPHMQYADPNFHTSQPLALLNIAVLLLTAIVAIFLTYGWLAFQQQQKEKA